MALETEAAPRRPGYFAEHCALAEIVGIAEHGFPNDVGFYKPLFSVP